MANDIKLGITIKAEGSAQVTGEIDKIKQAVGGAGKAADSSNRQFAGMAQGLGSLRGIIATLGLAALVKDLVDTVKQVQVLDIRLKGLTSSAKDYAAAQGFLSTVSKTHHKDNLSLADSYSKLLAIENAGLITRQQANALLVGMSNAQSKTGATTAQLQQSMYGLSQALGSGVVHMEELNQVSEPMPGLLNQIAISAGYTVGEFRKLVAEGQITSEQFGVIMVKAFNAYEGAAEAAGNTLVAKQSDIQNAWTDLARVMETPINEVLTPVLELVAGAIRTLAWDVEYLQGAWAKLTGIAQGFDDIKAGGMRPPGYVAEKKQRAAEQAQAEADSAEIVKQSATAQKQTWDWLAETEEKHVKQSIARTGARASAHKSAAVAVKSAAQMEAEALAANYQRLSESLAREAALKGDSSRLAALEYDLQAGALKDLTEAQKLYLLQTTGAIENAKIEATLAEDKKTEMDALIDKYNQLTLSAREYYQLQLTNKGIAPDQQGEYLAKYDQNAAYEKQSKDIDDASQSVSAYIDNLDKASESMQDFGDISGAIFDESLGGVNLLIGALKNAIKVTDDHTKKLTTNARQQAENAKIVDPVRRSVQEKALIEDRINLDNQSTQIQLSNIRQIMSATAQMFDQQSAGYKALSGLANGIGGIEANMSLQQAAKGMTGFAATATSLAGSASLVVGMIEAFRSIGSILWGGSSTGKRPTIAGTGTVLGDAEAVSESIANVRQTLEDIHADEYKELRGINTGIKSLTDSITGSITNLFSAGGLPDVKISGLGEKQNLPAPFIDIFNFFGKTSKKVVGGGVRIMAAKIDDLLQGVMVDAMQYTTIETTKTNFFGGKKTTYKNKLTALDAEFTDSLTDIFVNAASVIGQLSEQLGAGLGDKVKNYIIPAMNVELKGLNSEESVKALSGAISAALDDMASSVFGGIIGQYQQLGEGMLETATRIVAQMAVVKDALAASGLSMGDNAIYISDALAQAAGGLDEFQAQFETFYDKFYTDVEKQARLTDRLAGQLGDIFPVETIGILGTAREEYRKVIEALDMSNALDRERYSLLLRLAGAADQYYTALEQGAEQAARAAEEARIAQEQLNQSYIIGLESVLNAQEQAYQDRIEETKKGVSDAFAALQRAVNAEKASVTTSYNSAIKRTQSSIDAISESVQRLTSLSSALRSSLNALNPPGQELSSRQAAQGVLTSSLAAIRRGGMPNEDALNKALSTVAEPSEGLFSSFTDYQRDFYRTAIDISTMSEMIDAQLSKQKSALDIAKEQLELQKIAFDKQIDALDQIVENGQDMIDALNVVAKGIGSVTRALDQLQSAIGQQRAAGGGGGVNGVSDLVSAAQGYADPAQGTIASLYKGILGRAPDDGGLNYWTSSLKSGQTVEAIAASFKASPEYQVIKAVRGYASGGDHPGGWRIVGEQGPELEFTRPSRIVNNSDTRKMLSYDELIAEVKSLRSDLRAGQLAIAKNTQDTAKKLQKWDADGMPAVTV